MAVEDAKWYVIHTYSGYEAMVKDSLEKLIENNNLQENIFEIQIPTEETLEEKANGKKNATTPPLFRYNGSNRDLRLPLACDPCKLGTAIQ